MHILWDRDHERNDPLTWGDFYKWYYWIRQVCTSREDRNCKLIEMFLEILLWKFYTTKLYLQCSLRIRFIRQQNPVKSGQIAFFITVFLSEREQEILIFHFFLLLVGYFGKMWILLFMFRLFKIRIVLELCMLLINYCHSQDFSFYKCVCILFPPLPAQYIYTVKGSFLFLQNVSIFPVTWW